MELKKIGSLILQEAIGEIKKIIVSDKDIIMLQSVKEIPDIIFESCRDIEKRDRYDYV